MWDIFCKYRTFNSIYYALLLLEYSMLVNYVNTLPIGP
jgi:hypothetical protein